jgi:hypothetical protein
VAQLAVGPPTAREHLARLRDGGAVVPAAGDAADAGPLHRGAGAHVRRHMARLGVAVAEPAVVAEAPSEEAAVRGRGEAVPAAARDQGDDDALEASNPPRLVRVEGLVRVGRTDTELAVAALAPGKDLAAVGNGESVGRATSDLVDAVLAEGCERARHM